MSNQNLPPRADELEPVEQREVVTPLVDVFENADEVLLVADVPGVPDQGLKLDVDKDHLTLVGHRGAQAPGLQVVETEYRELDFRRSFKLPYGLDASAATAELKGGVLRVRVPKSEAVKPRRINIRIG